MTCHVLVARLDSAGDVLLAGPAIRAVAHGSHRVTLLCGRRGEAAARLLPAVDEVIVHTAEWVDPDPGQVDRESTLALVDALARAEIDRAVIFTSFHQSPLPLALLLRLAGVPQIAAASVDYPGSLLDLRHPVDPDVHEVERSLSLVRRLGYALPPGDDGRLTLNRAHCLQPALPRPYVVVHPGADAPARAWAPHRHAELVAALADSGRQVVVTGGPTERALTRQVTRHPRAGVVNAGGKTTLAQLADVIAGADLLVSGNTGPAHVAAAVGTPVVSLYAPTVPASRWRPWKVPHVLLHADVACAGCRARECPQLRHACLDDVSLDAVLAAVEQLAPQAATEARAA